VTPFRRPEFRAREGLTPEVLEESSAYELKRFFELIDTDAYAKVDLLTNPIKTALAMLDRGAAHVAGFGSEAAQRALMQSDPVMPSVRAELTEALEPDDEEETNEKLAKARRDADDGLLP